MAKTFYKYQDREPSSFIDWSVIGKTITDDLSNKVQEREEKKAKIEKDTKDMITKLNDVQLGENDGLNKFWLDGAAQITQNSLILNRLLKSGKINMKDYNIRMQNMQDGVTGGIQLINELNASYTEAMERYKKGESGALELWSRSKVEQFGNFGDSGMVINPSNYVVNVAKTDKDGKIVDTMSFQQLRKTNKQKYDKFNAKGEVQSIVGQLAKQYENVIKKGGVLTLDDVRQNPNMSAALDKYIDAALVDPNAMLDLLIEYAPESYDIADKSASLSDIESAKLIQNAKAEGKIYVEFDPKNPTSGRYVAVLSEEQKKEAKEIMLGLIDVAIPKGVTPMPVFAPQTPTAKDTSGDRVMSDKINMLKDLYEGTNKAKVNAAITYFEAEAGIKKITRQEDGIYIEFDDPKTNPPTLLRFDQGFELFAKGARPITGIEDTSKAMQLSGGPTTNAPSSTVVESLQSEDVDAAYSRLLNEKYINSSNSYKADADATAKALNQVYSGLGITFEPNNEVIGDDLITVVIGEGDKAVKSGEISLADGAAAREAVNDFLKSAAPSFEGYILAEKSKIKAGGVSPKDSGKSISKAEFQKMTPAQRSKFKAEGGTVNE